MKLRLSIKLAVYVFAIAAIGGGVALFLAGRSASEALQQSISVNQSNTAEQTMDKLDRFLYERLIGIQEVAARQQIREYLESPSSRSPSLTASQLSQLNSFRVLSGTWSDVSILEPSGKLALSTANSRQIQALLDQSAVKKLVGGAAAGRAGYSDVFPDPSTGAPDLLFVAPVRSSVAENPSVVGVLVGELSWPSVLEILQTVKSTTELVNSTGISLGDNDSAGSKKDAVFGHDYHDSRAFQQAKKQRAGTAELPILDEPGTLAVASYVREPGYLDYGGNSWYLFIESPKSAVFAPINQLVVGGAAAFAAVFIPAILLLLWILARTVVDPIKLLQAGADRLAGGNFSQPVIVKSGDEIGDLAMAFNEMSAKLQMAYGSLKQSISDKENEKRTMQQILESLPVGVLVVKAPTGEHLLMNKAGEQIAGVPMGPNLGQSDYPDAYHITKPNGKPYPPEQTPLSITLRTGKSATTDDMVVHRPDGTAVEIRSVTGPIVDSDGQIRRAVSVFEDVSKERLLERSREEFFSIASHELRTPLTAIRGNTSLIKEYMWKSIRNKDLKGMIEDIHESSIRLIEIVNDFLDTSRLEQNRMKYELVKFDLADLVQAVMREFTVTSSRRQVKLEVKPPASPLPPVLADKNRTKQVLINLVGNALKFTNSGSVAISFAQNEQSVTVRVSDTGQGMSRESQRLLFKKFEQTGDSVLTRDSVRGTGLGLYISKMIIEQMRGHIRLESSKLGVGATFAFDLPTTDSDAGTGPSASDIQPNNLKI